MRIWFDISNSPHVLLFNDLIKDLEQSGHEMLITTRPLANTIDLLDQKGLDYRIIGKHYGKNIFKKLFGFPIRVIQLYWHLRSKNVDFAIAQSSFHLPLTARLLRIPSIYTNDNEHAAGNFISFYFAHKILLPDTFILNKYLNNPIIKSKIIFYPGVKEGIYLWIKHQHLMLTRNNELSKCINIYIRPEPQTAQYYTGALFFLDDLILELQNIFNITILTRNKDQFDHYKNELFKLCRVPQKPLDFEEIAQDCNLFIGAGGSMTREFALLGIPTISVYQDKLLAVDSLLLQYKLLHYFPQLDLSNVLNVLEESKTLNKSNPLLDMGKQAYNILKAQIIAFESN